MPVEIKNAVATCSVEKMNEAKQEYAALKPIFEKLELLSPEEKVLPLDPEHAKLSNDEEKIMVAEGYLKRDGVNDPTQSEQIVNLLLVEVEKIQKVLLW
jgi:hypothetical protein